MKKIILLVSIYFTVVHFVIAQIPQIRLQTDLGGSGDETSPPILIKTNDGYITATSTFSNDGLVSGNHGSVDIWIVKLNFSWEIQWQKCLGGTGVDYVFDIKKTNDDGYILIGQTSSSNDGDVGNNHGGEDMWVVKIDSLANIQWQKCYGGSSHEEGKSVELTNDGGYILAGRAMSNDGDVSYTHAGSSDYWLVKVDSVGNILWEHSYGGSTQEILYTVKRTSDNGFIMAGETMSGDGDVTGFHGGNDFWIVKTDSVGNLIWQKCLGGTSNDHARDIAESSSGYLVVGITQSMDGDVSGYIGGALDGWIVKLDTGGNLQWQKCLGGTDEDSFFSMLKDDNGNYILGGYTMSDDVNVSGNNGQWDYWVVDIDSLGNLQWQKCFGTAGDELWPRLSFTNTHQLLIAGLGYPEINGSNPPYYYGGYDSWLLEVGETNNITGTCFGDLNNNLIQDLNELSINNHQIVELISGRLSFTNQSGFYDLSVLDSGNFTVVPEQINYYNSVPATHNVFFSGINQIDSLNDFAFQPTGVFNDLCVTITPMGNFRANMNANYMINYENVGTTTLNGTVIFFPDNDVTFVSSNPIATSVTIDSIVWNVGTLTPFQTGNISVTVHVNSGTPIGTLINSSVEIDPVAGDANTACNYNSWEVYTTGSVDPNAILVDRDTVLTTELSSPPFLNYIIYFQNTGNDTAFNARVLNNIPQMLDVNSFEFVSSSHPVNLNYGAASRLFTFSFDNINLPDSGANEPASHGFIRYRIKPLSTLVAGDEIKNNAAIYFDFNQPVMTDTAVTEIVLPTGVSQLSVGSGQLKIFPNPSSDVITINSAQLTTNNWQLTITDLYGREVFQSEIQNPKSEIKINVSRFSQGVYFVQVKSGEKILREKFLKE